MPADPTNRDLYRAVSALRTRHGTGRTLETYLLALRDLARPYAGMAAIPFDAFVRLLDEAYTIPAPSFDDAWRALPDELATETATGFAGWEQLIIQQIRDLREMEEAGTMDDDLAWFGVDAPRGDRWYNFDPGGYLEAAAAGTFGGWRAGDAGRSLVPGPVAVLGEDGRITAMDPADVPDPVIALPEISWKAFTDFLQSGQWYE